jgi:hypothetical protein
MLKKKIWANFQRIVEVFTQKIFNMLSNIWVWDPGSVIRDPEKTYSGSRIPDPEVKRHQIPDPGSGSATLPVRPHKLRQCQFSQNETWTSLSERDVITHPSGITIADYKFMVINRE